MLEAIEFAAVVSSAIYGVLRAARKGLDVVGIASLAFAVAFGGGTLRDLFLDRHPLFWITNAHYPMIVFGIAVVGSIVPALAVRLERLLDIPDALGLGLFSVVGAGYAMEAETGLFVASILGVVTGTFGGVIGDIICNEIPSLFRPSPLYATCSFAGAWTFLLSSQWNASAGVAVAAGLTVTVVLRLAAIHWDIHIPARQP